MNLIVAVDKNWAIGKDNKLLVSIPQDMKFFRETTMGKVVVMGRKTLESFPGGQPLKQITNIVLTTDKDYSVKDAIVVHTIDELLEELKKYNDEEIYVIGGESIYRELLPFCKEAYVTRIDYEYQADRYFPILDEMEEELFVTIVYGFVDKLIDMGAQIILCDPHRAAVIGQDHQHQLRAAKMSSPDIRAGVALLIAAMSAEGTSRIENIGQIDRGYEKIETRLNALGAHISRV